MRQIAHSMRLGYRLPQWYLCRQGILGITFIYQKGTFCQSDTVERTIKEVKAVKALPMPESMTIQEAAAQRTLMCCFVESKR
ncbi:hypothetical protein MKW98_018735 [Papaver atlanticum]|uniref:Uncharacterized protein n=1 Tax=Papaver atlanticum TaxID=357466 RepID=A0AAD4XNI0_9MAGN|nr:hypothetical protein MKW98_018735 [Papaver atlanticum]